MREHYVKSVFPWVECSESLTMQGLQDKKDRHVVAQILSGTDKQLEDALVRLLPLSAANFGHGESVDRAFVKRCILPGRVLECLFRDGVSLANEQRGFVFGWTAAIDKNAT